MTSLVTNRIAIAGYKILTTKGPVRLALAFAFMAAALLATALFYYTPLQVDGGWYSYPALALARGGDSAENRLTVDELQRIEGVKANFGFDTRLSVRVLPMSWWFQGFGTSIWAVKLFGILELTVLVAIVYVLFRQVVQNKRIAALCWATYLLDTSVIGLGSADLRPDLMVAITTVFVFLFLSIDSGRHRLLVAVSGIFFMLLLPLIHLSAAVPIAFLVSYMVTELLMSWKGIPIFRKGLYCLLIVVGVAGFTLRQRILDLVVPTQHAIQLAFDEEARAYSTLADYGALPILQKEWHRWTDYFLMSNLAALLAIFVGMFLLSIYLLGPGSKRPASARLGILIGCLAAIGVLAVFDPQITATHAVPIVPFFFLVLGKELELIRSQNAKYLAVSVVFLLVFISAALKFALAGKIIAQGIESGYSNASVASVMDRVFDLDKSYVVIGPTEVWPYVNPKVNVVIVDARSAKMDSLVDVVQRTDLVILNREYNGYFWESRFREYYPSIRLQSVASVADANTGPDFLKVVKLHH